MPRPVRAFVAGAIYHVVSRGNRQQPIFLSERDHELFLEIASRVVRKRMWSVHSYCLMPNHYHLLLQIRDADLSAGMQEINGTYGTWFNRLHGFAGHVFQDRFKAIPVNSEGHLLHLTRYIARNPVRAKLCVAPEDWRWSSFHEIEYAGHAWFPLSSRILALFGDHEDRAREIFRMFVLGAGGR
jgi:REP-associated tyrosine transposase